MQFDACSPLRIYGTTQNHRENYLQHTGEDMLVNFQFNATIMTK